MDNAKPPQIRGTYQFTGFQLNAAERQLWFEKQPISLKPKQFDLLFYFVQNAGRAVTKSELLDSVWAETFVEEKTLARNVSWLRTALGKYADGDSIIETVPKLGYRFTPQVTISEPEEEAIIVEKQTVQYIRGEETITIDENIEEKKIANSEETDKSNLLQSPESSPRAANFSRSLPFSLSLYFSIALALIGIGGIIFTLSKNPIVETAEEYGLNVRSSITIKNIAVDSRSKNVEIGIKIQSGDVIKVSAVGEYDPGNGELISFHGDPDLKAVSGHAFPDAAPQTLVAWVGTENDRDGYFQTNKTTIYKAGRDGSLYLAVNDLTNGYTDNRGTIIAAVVVHRKFTIESENFNIAQAWGKELVRIYNQDTLAIRAAGNVAYWETGELYDLDGIPPDERYLEEYLAPGLDARTLIGKLDNNKPFKIGTNFPPQKMNAGGDLYISVNERIMKSAYSYKNDSGEITVDIEVVRQAESITNPL